jgi:hypothetical protein
VPGPDTARVRAMQVLRLVVHGPTREPVLLRAFLDGVSPEDFADPPHPGSPSP